MFFITITWLSFSILSTVFEKPSFLAFTETSDFVFACTCSFSSESITIIFESAILSICISYTSFISLIGKYTVSFSFIACALVFLVEPFNVNLFDSKPILAILSSYVVTISFISSSIYIYLSKKFFISSIDMYITPSSTLISFFSLSVLFELFIITLILSLACCSLIKSSALININTITNNTASSINILFSILLFLFSCFICFSPYFFVLLYYNRRKIARIFLLFCQILITTFF